MSSTSRHEIVEKNVGLLATLILVAISFGALVEITPLMYQNKPQSLWITFVHILH